MENQLFKNKFRIQSTRLPNYDYSSNGIYYVTICTKNREPFFGEIINGKMALSEMGKTVKKFWYEIPNRQRPTLGQIVGYFKYQSTKSINEFRNMPGVPIWQTRFHERIIRNEHELNIKRKYIINNPINWKFGRDGVIPSIKYP